MLASLPFLFVNIGAELAPEWARLVADCLRTDPARRPQDAHALLARGRGVGVGVEEAQCEVGLDLRVARNERGDRLAQATRGSRPGHHLDRAIERGERVAAGGRQARARAVAEVHARLPAHAEPGGERDGDHQQCEVQRVGERAAHQPSSRVRATKRAASTRQNAASSTK